MIKAGIKETKNNLSRYLMHVKAGEEVVITERGKPVARIIREEPGGRSIREILAPLAKHGRIVLPTRKIERKRLTPAKISGKPVSEMIIEDRR